jgi:hypothetical protein
MSHAAAAQTFAIAGARRWNTLEFFQRCLPSLKKGRDAIAKILSSLDRYLEEP